MKRPFFLTTVLNDPWLSMVLMGILLGFAYPPLGLAPAIIPAFWLLLRELHREPAPAWQYLRIYLGCVLWNAITTWWLSFATVAGGVAAVLANAGVMLIPMIGIKRILRSDLAAVYKIFLIPAVWVSYELLHHRWDLAWPWLSFGNAFSIYPWAVQFIEYTGYLGISYWMVASAAALFYFLKAQIKESIAGSVFLVPLLISFLILGTHQLEVDEVIEVGIVQPNFDSYQEMSGFRHEYEALDITLHLTDSIRTEKTAVVLWPENAIQIAMEEGHNIQTVLTQKASQWGFPIITGSNFFKYYLPGEAPSLTRGTTYAGVAYDLFNASLGFYPDGSALFYGKGRLVPIVEHLPFAEAFPVLAGWSSINWGRMMGFQKGTVPLNFPAESTSFPALVCYDSVFPEWTRLFIKDGAGFIGIITNDGWWGETFGHIQHFEFARLRSIETRRYIARSANNGFSGVIDPYGNVVKKTRYWERTAFTHDIPILKAQTFYVRHGDWLGWMCLLATGIVLVWLARVRTQKD